MAELDHTYHGRGYALHQLDQPGAELVHLQGAFRLEQDIIGTGGLAVAAIIDNGEGGRYLATELDNLREA
jgi:hypothetical protein